MEFNKPPLWILAKVTSRKWKCGGGGGGGGQTIDAHGPPLFHCLQSPNSLEYLHKESSDNLWFEHHFGAKKFLY